MIEERKRVAILVETSHGSGRQILAGIASFARNTDNWALLHNPVGLESIAATNMDSWEVDGIIARIHNAELYEQLDSLKIPVVDVLGKIRGDIPLVHVDNAAIAQHAARHLAEQGFSRFAYLGIRGENWSEQRLKELRKICQLATSFDSLELENEVFAYSPGAFDELRRWVRSLQKPVGVMVGSDQRGVEFLEACAAEGISVPEQIAVIGVDNDDTLCHMSLPPLSSVRGGHQRVGFEAARLLDNLMIGDETAPPTTIVPPTGVEVRGSSSSYVVDDEKVALGIRFIKTHLSTKITNEQIARHVGLSKTVFQNRFTAATELSVHQFILKLRLDRATQLLTDTNLSIAEVADRSGFRHQEYLGHVFKKHIGKTPRQVRLGSSGDQ